MNTKYKIGDKVKLCNPMPPIDEKTIGVVIEIGKCIGVRWDTDKCLICRHSRCHIPVITRNYYPGLIKSAMRIGEQLMLFEL